jgi:hypothetical protein
MAESKPSMVSPFIASLPAPLAEALVIYVGQEAYAISPVDQETFVQELEQRRRLGAVQTLTPGIHVAHFLVYDFWADSVIRRLLLITLTLNLLLFGALAVIYPALPAEIEWRGDQIGAAAELVPRVCVSFFYLLPPSLRRWLMYSLV